MNNENISEYSFAICLGQTNNLMQGKQKAFKTYEAYNDYIRRFIHRFRYFETRIVFWHESKTNFLKRVEALQYILDHHRYCLNYKSCFHQKLVDRLSLLAVLRRLCKY